MKPDSTITGTLPGRLGRPVVVHWSPSGRRLSNPDFSRQPRPCCRSAVSMGLNQPWPWPGFSRLPTKPKSRAVELRFESP